MPKLNRKAPKGQKHTQSVLVPKAKFNLAQAKAWVKKHGEHGKKFITRGLDEGGPKAKFYHFRQYDPNDTNFRYYNQTLANGVVYVNAVPKTAAKKAVTAVRKGFWGGQILQATRAVGELGKWEGVIKEIDPAAKLNDGV